MKYQAFFIKNCGHRSRQQRPFGPVSLPRTARFMLDHRSSSDMKLLVVVFREGYDKLWAPRTGVRHPPDGVRAVPPVRQRDGICSSDAAQLQHQRFCSATPSRPARCRCILQLPAGEGIRQQKIRKGTLMSNKAICHNLLPHILSWNCKLQLLLNKYQLDISSYSNYLVYFVNNHHVDAHTPKHHQRNPKSALRHGMNHKFNSAREEKYRASRTEIQECMTISESKVKYPDHPEKKIHKICWSMH